MMAIVLGIIYLGLVGVLIWFSLVQAQLASRNKTLTAALSQREASATEKRMMGIETEGDQKISITVRDWEALRRAIWRSAVGWEIIANQAIEILDRCEHTEGCPGAESEVEACLQDKRFKTEDGTTVLVPSGCRDREARMSALVILNAARQHSPTDVRKPADGPYFAPSREYFSEVLSSLHAAQVENDRLQNELRQTTTPPAPKELTE